MSFTIAQLLLTTARQAQLTTALANAGVTAPLDTIIAEAEARVDMDLAGLTVAEALRNSVVRAFSLHMAYGLCGPVPKDILSLFEDAVKLLERVRQRSAPEDTDSAASGLYGGDDRVEMRA